MKNYPFFIEVPQFTKKWARLGFNDDDLRKLQNILMDEPKSGDMIKGTGGVRKYRFALKNRGKSGSVRVCYVHFSTYEIFFMLTVYSKKEKENLEDEEKKAIKKLVNTLLEETKRRFGT